MVDQESVPVCVVSEHEDPKFIQMLLNIGIVVFDVNRADIGTVIEMLKKVQVKVMDDANGKSGTEVN